MQTEILLFTDTSFAHRELCERDETAGKEPQSSAADQLEKACWSGILFEMLPEVFEVNKQNLFIWKINQADQYISIIMGPAPSSLKYVTSIDPHFFLQLPIYDN